MDFITWAVAGLVGFGLGWGVQSAKMAGARELRAKIEKELAAATAYSSGLKEQLDTLHTEKQALGDELAAYRDKAVSLEARKEDLEKRVKEQQEQLKLEFKNTATSIFEDMSKKFSAHSEKQIGDILNPLRERLGEFHKLVGDSFTAQRTEQNSLKNEIGKIVLQADTLSKALRGDVKAQGNWGEIMLERILEESGLRKDTDYILQATEMGLVASDGSRQRPDVIVNLPDNKHIIIDAKVSLTAYERYSAETDAAAKELHLREFLKSIKAHVNGLELRRYQDNEKLTTPDFVLMFMPIEGAYSVAMQQDSELHSYAWGKRIVIVCPTTLFATLRTIASLWSIERQNKNAQHIAAEAGKMYDKFVDFIKDMNNIGNRLSQLQTSYDDAFNKLSKGRGSLVSRAEKLKELDVKATKPLSIKSDESQDDNNAPLPKLLAEG